MLHLEPVLLVGPLDLLLQFEHAVCVQLQAQGLRCFLNDAGWQVDLECQVLADLDPVSLGIDD